MTFEVIMGLAVTIIFAFGIVFLLRYTQDDDFNAWVKKHNPLVHKTVVDVLIVKIEQIENIGGPIESNAFAGTFKLDEQDEIQGYMVQFQNYDIDIQLVLTPRQAKKISVNQTGYLTYSKTQFLSFLPRK